MLFTVNSVRVNPTVFLFPFDVNEDPERAVCRFVSNLIHPNRILSITMIFRLQKRLAGFLVMQMRGTILLRSDAGSEGD